MTTKRGGARIAPESERRAKLAKLKHMLGQGYGMEIACKRAGTTSITARKWAKELGVKL
jgi:hypothetical protein